MGARQEKEKIVAEIREKLSRSRSVVLVDYRGLTVAQATRLRRKAREAGVEYRVLKNTLVRLAARDLGLILDPLLEGPVALAFGYQDPVAPAKVLADFIKEFKILEIKGGVVEGQVVDATGIKALADLPPREVLLGKVLSGLQAPLVGLVSVLGGPLRGLVYAVEAWRKEREAGAQA